MAKNEVATTTAGTFELVSMYSGMDEELKAQLQEEMDDLGADSGIDCRQIKMPTGTIKAFAVESDNPDDPDMMKELEGVILYTHLMNARWEGDYSGENRMPVCSSWDAKTGIQFGTGECMNCDRCSYNQFTERADGTSGKDCKNMRRIYLMLNGKPQLYLLTVPPTSLNDVKKQLKRIMSRGIPYTRMVVTFKLVSATSRGGQSFAKLTVEKTGDLTPEQSQMARAMREEILKQYQNIAITSDDYYTPEDQQAGVYSAPAAGQAGTDGFMDVPDGLSEENLPFN